MGIMSRWLWRALLAIALCCLLSCTSTNAPAPGSGQSTGFLYVTAQGDTTVSAFTVNLTDGTLTANGSSVPTGLAPSAIAITPDGTAAFVANSSANTVSSYTVNSDGTLKLATGSQTVGMTPVSLAIDPGGKFLFVANQGTFSDPSSGSISVFSIQGTGLTEVAGSPFSTATAGVTTGTGPASIAVTPSGTFLYVANRFTNTVSAFSYDSSSGLLSAVANSPYAAENAPTAVAVSRDGNYLYVANSGSNNVSAFAICAVASASCLTPDGTLTPVSGSPFAAGLAPVYIAVNPVENGVYVVDQQSNQISQFTFSPGTGALSPLSPATIATGATPVWAAVHPDGAWLFVADNGGATVTGFVINTTNSHLGPLTTAPTTTAAQPSAIALR